MKNSLFALCTVILLASCADSRIVKTDVATGATNPKAIYIRPFSIRYTDFYGYNNTDLSGGDGEAPIRHSLAPAEFAIDLRNELSKLAPSMVLKDDEVAHVGWLVTGNFDVVNSGDYRKRTVDAGHSHVKLHVRIIDLESHNTRGDVKDVNADKELTQGRGNVIYEFDVESSSRLTGMAGSVYAPGLGYSIPFDFKNAAERIMMALSTDPHKLGDRDTTTIR